MEHMHADTHTCFSEFAEQHEISRWRMRACRLYTTNHVRLITLRDGLKNGRKRELNEKVANKITEFALTMRDTLLEGSFYHVKKIAPVCTFRFDAMLLTQGESASNIIFFFCSYVSTARHYWISY